MIDNSIEKGFFFFFSIFLIMKVSMPLLDTDTLEYFWMNTSFILWMRDGKIKRFFFYQISNLYMFCFNDLYNGR